MLTRLLVSTWVLVLTIVLVFISLFQHCCQSLVMVGGVTVYGNVCCKYPRLAHKIGTQDGLTRLANKIGDLHRLDGEPDALD